MTCIDPIAWNGIVPGGMSNFHSGKKGVHLSVMDPSDPKSIEVTQDLQRFIAVVHRQKHADTVVRVDRAHAHPIGLKFYQNPTGAVLCEETTPPECLVDAWNINTHHTVWRNLKKASAKYAIPETWPDHTQSKWLYHRDQQGDTWDTVATTQASIPSTCRSHDEAV